MALSALSRRFTEEQKRELINNLDFEVSQRMAKLRRELDERLDTFKSNQRSILSSIPKEVRALTMREFGEKYNGNIRQAVLGCASRAMSQKAQGLTEKFDKETRKRKYEDIREAEDGRNTKNARTQSPGKHAGSSTGPGTSQRAQMLAGNKTPAKNRLLAHSVASPTPNRTRPPFNAGGSSRPPSRIASPVKPQPLKPPSNQTSRVPSSSVFNPSMPAKAPSYPKERPLRHDESLRSINGSPIANPFLVSESEQATRTLARPKSNINIRRDPSFALPRSDSQASNPASDKHRSRNNSTDTLVDSTSLPSTQASSNGELSKLALPFTSLTRSYSVTIATTDGHLLEFDPLQTSPRALDALEGITDAAKLQAKKEMGRLVQAAVEKWKIA